ncbi:GFA family protein [Oceanicoccus sp. KOV_DT_Chl]|uniref:GFA family protein n=1 Tax=Oceanicoccus sp. KOV_DT_Chl TaxID=1904639 RepID=UPI000C7AA58D|nr:GFA family protein [Oceanicoccus sp. KOV_DT_Chl]
MSKMTGACLCGQVKYHCAAEPIMTAVCHCRNCQRQSGTAFSIIIGVPAKSVVFEGKDNVAEYMDKGESGGVVRRQFCRNCGSPLLSIVESAPDLEIIKAGTLDDHSWLKPTMHFWCDSAQPWVQIEDAIPRFARSPS